MELKLAPGQESNLLRRNLTSSRDAVLVPIAQEADAIATNRYVGVIRIIFFRTHFTYHHGVADFLPFMARDVVVVDKEEGVSACNPFCVGRRPVPMPWHSHPSSLA
jgi:hypothetical protein